MDKFHPNVWHLFDSFRIEEVCVRQSMLKATIGEMKTKNKKENDFQQQLGILQSQLEQSSITIDEYFRGITLLLVKKH